MGMQPRVQQWHPLLDRVLERELLLIPALPAEIASSVDAPLIDLRRIGSGSW
jgi:hypothetical protein